MVPAVELVFADRLLLPGPVVEVEPATEPQGDPFKPELPDIEGLLSPLPVPEEDPGVADGLAPAPELLPLAPPLACANAAPAVPTMRAAASNARVVPVRICRLLLRSPTWPNVAERRSFLRCMQNYRCLLSPIGCGTPGFPSVAGFSVTALDRSPSDHVGATLTVDLASVRRIRMVEHLAVNILGVGRQMTADWRREIRVDAIRH